MGTDLLHNRVFLVLGLLGGLSAVLLAALIIARGAAENLPNRSPLIWYVSPTGSDRPEMGTETKPLKTIQKALERAIPGDVIQLQKGEYRQSIKSVRGGKTEAPIILRGPKDAVVRGGGPRVAEINHSYIHLEGFTIDGKIGNNNKASDYRDKLIYVQGIKRKKGVEGLKITGMTIINAGGECVRLRYFARNNEISNTTIRNCGRFDFEFGDHGKNGEGIYIGTAPEQRRDGKNPTADPDSSRFNWIHHNKIETNANECVDIKEGASDNTVEYNDCSQQRDEKSGGFDARGNHNIFRFNTIHDTVGAGVRLGGDSAEDGINNEVYNNTFVRTAYAGIRILRQPQGKICNNTFQKVRQTLEGEYANIYRPDSRCKTP